MTQKEGEREVEETCILFLHILVPNELQSLGKSPSFCSFGRALLDVLCVFFVATVFFCFFF